MPIHLTMTLYVGIIFAFAGRFKPSTQAKRDAFRLLEAQLAKRKEIQHRRVCSCFDLIRIVRWFLYARHGR